jgi:transposase-like protein
MYPENVLYVKVELYIRNFENLRDVMVMVKEYFLFHEML